LHIDPLSRNVTPAHRSSPRQHICACAGISCLGHQRRVPREPALALLALSAQVRPSSTLSPIERNCLSLNLSRSCWKRSCSRYAPSPEIFAHRHSYVEVLHVTLFRLTCFGPIIIPAERRITRKLIHHICATSGGCSHLSFNQSRLYTSSDEPLFSWSSSSVQKCEVSAWRVVAKSGDLAKRESETRVTRSACEIPCPSQLQSVSAPAS
jgi:hypothetical protein